MVGKYNRDTSSVTATPSTVPSSSATYGRWAFGIGQPRRNRRGRTGIVKGRSVRSGGSVLTTLSCSASGIFAICCDLTQPTITRLARSFRSTRTRRRRGQYMPLVAFSLRHFLADSIICTYVFDFRQAQRQPLLDLACTLVSERANGYTNGPFFWNEVASGFIAGLVARHTLEFERRTRGVLGKDVLTRLRDYVIAHIDEPIEVSTLEDSGAQPVPFYPVVHPTRWRQSAPLRRAFAMATSGRACSSCPIRLGRCRGAHRLCRPGHLTRWVRRVHGVSLTELVA